MKLSSSESPWFSTSLATIDQFNADGVKTRAVWRDYHKHPLDQKQTPSAHIIFLGEEHICDLSQTVDMTSCWYYTTYRIGQNRNQVY